VAGETSGDPRDAPEVTGPAAPDNPPAAAPDAPGAAGKGGLVALAVAAVLVVGGVAAGLVVHHRHSEHHAAQVRLAAKVKAGDCFLMPQGYGSDVAQNLVPCTRPHDGEVLEVTQGDVGSIFSTCRADLEPYQQGKEFSLDVMGVDMGKLDDGRSDCVIRVTAPDHLVGSVRAGDARNE
jgi:hypothetical protein